MKNLLVAIPTKNREEIIPTVLQSLFHQTIDSFDVLIYDQGDQPVTENYHVRQFIDLLEIHKGIEVNIRRSMKDRSLAMARVYILKYVKKYNYRFVMMVDDDVMLMPDTIDVLLKKIKRLKDCVWIEGIAMDVNNILKHSDYDVEELESPKGMSPWAVNHHYFKNSFTIDRISTTGGFHYLFDMDKIDDKRFKKIIKKLKYLHGMPCEDIMLEYHSIGKNTTGKLTSDALIYHFPHTEQGRDWYKVTNKIQQRISKKGTI